MIQVWVRFLDASLQFTQMVSHASAAFTGPHAVFRQSDSIDKGEWGCLITRKRK